MSSIDGNGKGNLLISYLFKSESVVKQVEEEAELKVLIGNLLSTKGYKFVIADDELIDAKLIDENAKEGRMMERLTGRADFGLDDYNEICFINPDDLEGAYNLDEIVNHGSYETKLAIAERLAEYEDTGLTPEQVQELKEKQIPRKPVFAGGKYNCRCGWDINRDKQPFCMMCGSKIGWE